jgi:arylformamidase
MTRGRSGVERWYLMTGIGGQMVKMIDCTYTIEEGMTSFGAYWHSRVSINQVGRHGFEGRETREYRIGSHTGTHMDAPAHFVEGGGTIDQIPLERLVGPATIIDFSGIAENQAVTRDHLRDVNISEKMVFRFGWGRHWGAKKFYSGYPFFARESAECLIEKGVRMIGLDTPSPDDSRIRLDSETLGTAEDSPIHKLFLSRGVILVEYIANLDEIEDLTGWEIIALPLKFRNGDGSPARVLLKREQ